MATTAEELREKELTVVGGNPGALSVVQALREGFVGDTAGYERWIDKLIEEGSVGTVAYSRRQSIFVRIAEEACLG